MIYKVLDNFSCDVDRLREQFTSTVQSLSPGWTAPGLYGGWSVQSWSGRFEDGWEAKGEKAHQNPDGTITWDEDSIRGIPTADQQRQPTELMSGYVAEVYNELVRLDLQPCWMKWALLTKSSLMSVHRDYIGIGQYKWRLHIPVITNPDCIWWTEDGEAHLPADGRAYLVDLSRYHQSQNNSDQDRIHLICTVCQPSG